MLTVKKLAEYLNLHQTDAFVITVTGTNGKGSCVEMLTSVYYDAGYRVGTYTSPHLMHFNERVRIQKNPVNDELLTQAFDIIDHAQEETHITLNYFERITLVALWIFKQANLDMIILEVGIGGRLDATNILDADLAIITSIGLDHQDRLGHTRELIAREKAGILRSQQWAICGDANPPETLIQIAKDLDTHMTYMGKDFGYSLSSVIARTASAAKQDVAIQEEKNESYWNFYSTISNKNSEYHHLPMPYLMVNNVAIALQAILLLNTNTHFNINIQKAIQSIILTKLAGRCDVRKQPNGSTIIFDVAHNPQAASQLASFLDTYKKHLHPQKELKTIALFSMLQDKDIVGTVDILKDSIDEWHTAEINSERRASKAQLQAAFDHHHIVLIWHDSLEMACDFLKTRATRKHDLIVVFGSFLVVEVGINNIQ